MQLMYPIDEMVVVIGNPDKKYPSIPYCTALAAGIVLNEDDSRKNSSASLL